MRKTVLMLILLLSIIEAEALIGQACSCGEATLMSSMYLPSTPPGSWQVGADSFANGKLNIFGGKWLDFAPGIIFNLPELIGIRSSARILIYGELEGTQLTTSYTLIISIFYSISKSNQSFEL